MICRALIAAVASAVLAVGMPGVAMAQEAEPPVANCEPFSSIVCQAPVTINVGPIPVEVGSIFSPPPAAP